MPDGYCCSCRLCPSQITFKEFEEAFQEHVSASWPCPEYIITKGYTESPSEDIFTAALADDPQLWNIFCKFCGNVLSHDGDGLEVLSVLENARASNREETERGCSSSDSDPEPASDTTERENHGPSPITNTDEKMRVPTISGSTMGDGVSHRQRIRRPHPYNRYERELSPIPPTVIVPNRKRGRPRLPKRIHQKTTKIRSSRKGV